MLSPVDQTLKWLQISRAGGRRQCGEAKDHHAGQACQLPSAHLWVDNILFLSRDFHAEIDLSDLCRSVGHQEDPGGEGDEDEGDDGDAFAGSTP